MQLLREGEQAPDFTLPDQDGKEHSLSDYRGQWVLLYFYPKDDSPGCTVEACAIRDQYQYFKAMNTIILGVSTDSVASHRQFANKYELPFTLLSDVNKEVVGRYGVFGEKKYMGKVYMGTKRISFLINPEGRITRVYENVKPETHAGQVTSDLKTLA